MRTIKFRGKSNHPESFSYGDFVFGSLITRGELAPLINVYDENSSRDVRVDPNTIGQFTGMFCEGKEIYEGDIIHCAIGHSPNIFEITGVVEYHTCAFVMHYKHHNQDTYTWLDALIGADIIGNIHDNPELMEGGAK